MTTVLQFATDFLLDSSARLALVTPTIVALFRD